MDGPRKWMIPPPPPPPAAERAGPLAPFPPVAITAPPLLIDVLEARITIPPALAANRIFNGKIGWTTPPDGPVAEIEPLGVMTMLPVARIVIPPPAPTPSSE
jgi:hypothetical protein